MKTSFLSKAAAYFCAITAATITFSLLGLGSVARADTIVYSNTDGSTGTFSGGVTGTATGGTQSTSPSNELFREVFQGNSTFTVTLAGLAPNSTAMLSLDLYAIRTPDGNGPGGGNSPSNPDLFNITATSGTLLNASFDNSFVDTGQTYPSMYTGPNNIVNNPAGSGSSAENTLGYTYAGSIGDATYALSYSAVADASGSLVLTFTGQVSENEGNESFGLDNISVAGNVGAPSVPESGSTAALLGLSALGLFYTRKLRA